MLAATQEEIDRVTSYFESQAPDLTVEFVEKVRTENVLGHCHEIWDIHTDKDRWWVITNPSNLYSQDQFPNMDLALTFHVGLCLRISHSEKSSTATVSSQEAHEIDPTRNASVRSIEPARYVSATKQDVMMTPKPADRRVFIVHGHDDAPREAVARFLEKAGFEAIILHERPNKGRTIITKFREESVGVGFAVVLMTPDDLGKAKGAPDLNLRARQNVVFELGFFIGVLGPERVVALVKDEIERPSDFDGVVYIDFDARGAWKQKLGVELQAAGFEIEWKKAMI
jgi:predicted nucleotide-binding protein